MSLETFNQIKNLLEKNKVQFNVIRHEPVFTSEQAAKVRGVGLESGAKAMVLKSEENFYMFVLSSAKKLDFKKIKNILKTKSVRLATEEEILKKTNCKLGAVPPFGNLFGLDIYVDKSLLTQKEINFNAGLNDISISMVLEDYLKIIKLKLEEFSK